MKMKRTLALVLCLMLCASSALAGGLSGLVDNQQKANTGIAGLVGTEKRTELPDPAAVLGTVGEVFAEGYEFIVGYYCTVYSYPNPNSETKFINEYSAIARNNGYTVSAVDIPEMSGLSGYSVQNGNGKTAYIALGVEGNKLFLMVEEGMEFAQQAKTRYFSCVWNGEEVELPYSYSNAIGGINLYFNGDIGLSMYRDLQISLPKSLYPGTSLYVENGTYVNDFRIIIEHKETHRDLKVLEDRDSGFTVVGTEMMNYREDGITGDHDYAYLTIESREDIDSRTMELTGTLEGCFFDGALKITNGTFHVVCDK